MEKPPALSSASLAPVFAARGDLTVAVGYKKSFMPAVTKTVELIESGQLGAIQSILAEYPVEIPRADTAGTSPDWLLNGCHPLSAIVRIAGRVREVTTFRGPIGGSTLVLRHENGVLSTLRSGGWRGYSAIDERYRVDGERAAVVIDNSSRVILARGIPFVYDSTASFAPPGTDHGSVVWEVQNRVATLDNKALFLQGFVDELRRFFDAISTGEQPWEGSLEFADHLMRIYEAALASDDRAVAV